MSLRNVRSQKIKPGPKRGCGAFHHTEPSGRKDKKAKKSQTIEHHLSNSTNGNAQAYSLTPSNVGHKLSDIPYSNNNSQFFSSPAIDHKLVNSNNNFNKIAPINRSVRKVPMKSDKNGNNHLIPNNGPKRGAAQGPNIMHNWSVIASNKSSGPMIVPLEKDENGKYHLVPNEGPKRGVFIGPGTVHFNSISSLHNGPKRGVGFMNIMSQLNEYDKRAVEYVNNFRKENGLPSLQYSKLLSEIAMPHTLDMLNKKVPLGHSGFNERSQKVPSYRATGENVGYEYGYGDPMKTLFDGWLHSPPHRRNMLGNFNFIGVAFANKGDLWYGTQFFALI